MTALVATSLVHLECKMGMVSMKVGMHGPKFARALRATLSDAPQPLIPSYTYAVDMSLSLSLPSGLIQIYFLNINS